MIDLCIHTRVSFEGVCMNAHCQKADVRIEHDDYRTSFGRYVLKQAERIRRATLAERISKEARDRAVYDLEYAILKGYAK